jgi:hypothetical protein
MTYLSPYRDAIRLLYILVKGSSPHDDSEDNEIFAVFKGEARIHALDFWMRYPDYLAEELLDRYEQHNNVQDLLSVKQIFSKQEPELRKFPMIRYRFGAYEKIDNTVSILRSRNLISVKRKTENGVLKETDFHVHKSAFSLADDIVKEWTPLSWYADRAELVVDVAGDRGGTALKDRQYQQIEYAATQLGGVIPSISARVLQRYGKLVE